MSRSPLDGLAGALSTTARLLDGLARKTRPARRVLVLGGARSGKSGHAESLIERYPRAVYLATGPRPGPDDADWAERVRLHQVRRPAHWRTVETSDPAAELRRAEVPVLLDSLSTWLTSLLDAEGAWGDTDGWRERVDARITDFVAAWRDAPVPVVAVSDEVGSGVIPATTSGRVFRDVLGALNASVAAASDRVVLVVAGRTLEL